MTLVERIILAVTLAAFLVGAGLFLTGCNSYQPPGGDLWIAVKQQQELAR